MANSWVAANTKWVNDTEHFSKYGTKTKGIEIINPNPDPHILQMWILKNPDLNSTYIMLNEYDQLQVDNRVDAIWEVNPEIENSNVDKEKLKQFMALNISQLYSFYNETSE